MAISSSLNLLGSFPTGEYNPGSSASQAVSQGNQGASNVGAAQSNVSAPQYGVSAPSIQGLLPPTPTASTPLKSTSITNPDGTNVTHSYQTYTGQLGANQVNIGTASDPNIQTNGAPTPPPGPVGGTGTYNTVTGLLNNPNTTQSTGNSNVAPLANGNTQQAAQGVYNAGQQTQNEQQTQAAVEANEQMTPEETYYNNMATTAGQLQNINTLSPYAESQLYGQPGQQLAPDEQAPDLAGRASGTDALAGNLGNIFGSAAQTGYANALQQQNLGLNAAENAYAGAQNQAGVAQTSAADVLQSSTPQPYAAGSTTPYNPVTGTYGSIAGTTQPGGLASTGALQTESTQGSQVQTMTGIQQQAESLGNQLTSVINSGSLDLSNAGVLTQATNAVNQYLQGQAVDPQYQNFANLVTEVANKYSSILNQSGGTPTDVSTVSHNILNMLGSGQSIEQVLSSLDQNATSSINALKNASQTNAVSGSSSSGLYNF